MNNSTANPISTGSTYFLSKDEISVLSQKASYGDADSAFRLYQYYQLSVLDEKKSEYWLRVAAQEGHQTALYNISTYYADDCKPKTARYWANRLMSVNPKEGAEVLEYINDSCNNHKINNKFNK